MAFIQINGVSIHYEEWCGEGSETLVLLHGFTGSTKTWHPFIHYWEGIGRIVAVDLMGHGLTESPTDKMLYTMEQQVEILHALFTKLGLLQVHLLGYSMGGRVALSYAVRYPDMVKTLIIESATPGMKEESARLERQQHDHALARKIEESGVEAFIDFWENIPLFASQKKLPMSRQEALRNERTAQHALGLASSLRMMGTGIMPSVWESLDVLQMPVTLMTGKLDEKFVAIAKQMTKEIGHAKHIVVPGVGHAIHVENPEKFATIVKETILIN